MGKILALFVFLATFIGIYGNIFTSILQNSGVLKPDGEEQLGGQDALPNVSQKERGPKGDSGSVEKVDGKKRKIRSVTGPPANPPFNTVGGNSYQQAYFMGQCMMCPPGREGPRGPPGPQGVPGRDGRDGRDIAFGFPEVMSGAPAYTFTTNDVDRNYSYTSPGVPFTRWGRTTCPRNAVLIYSGVVAGGGYQYKGSGGNPLCLPPNPEYDHPVAGNQHSAYIYGAEYETFPKGRALGNNEVPCAVCMAPSHTHVLMIPGIMNCPRNADWTKQYHGYIMAAHNNHYRQDFTCMDHEAQGIPRTAGNENGYLFYNVEVQCTSTGGGLPCPPYIAGYELTCVVCTI